LDAVAAVPPVAIDLASERPFRVGRASVDPASREAAFDGQSERLQPQNLKVLIALVRGRGNVVTRDHLVDQCWDGRFVGDDVINRAISTLRQFAERAGGFSIETVPRSGYRLIEGNRRTRKIRWIAAAATLLFVMVFLVAALIVRPGVRSAPTPLTVGLLPFETSASDPATRAIAFAAHDSLSHALSRTRFALTEINPNARQQPAADFLISANVSSTPENIIATVRMEDSGRRIVVYSQRFAVSRDKAWTLPEFIGPQVAGSLGWTEPLLLADHRYPSNPTIVANLFYESGGDQIGDYDRTRRLASRAPESAIAQMALALDSAFALVDLPREQRADVAGAGRAAASNLERLAPDFGDSYVPWCLLHSPARSAECEDRLRAVKRRDPDSPWLDFVLAQELKINGRMVDALELARHSLAADEFIPVKIGLTLRMLEATGQKEEAERLYRQEQRWWPDDESIFWDRVYGMMDRGDFAALALFRSELRSEKLSAALEAVPPLANAVRSRDVAGARKTCPLVQPGSFKRDLCMLVFARLGDNDDAFALASQVFPDRVGRSPAEEDRVWLDNISVTDTDIVTGIGAAPLRRDPRYLALARRTGLLAYWRTGRLPDFCQRPKEEPICAELR